MVSNLALIIFDQSEYPASLRCSLSFTKKVSIGNPLFPINSSLVWMKWRFDLLLQKFIIKSFALEIFFQALHLLGVGVVSIAIIGISLWIDLIWDIVNLKRKSVKIMLEYLCQ